VEIRSATSGEGLPRASEKRRYRMTARQQAVDRTREQILEAAYRLWLERPYDEVTLDDIAEAAGVARQTVHRQFGSKDDLMVAVIDWRRPQEDAASFVCEPGDVESALRVQIDRYEVMGDALVRFLELEGRIEAIDHLLESGRAGHRAEIEHAFGPYLARRSTRQRERAVLALYAATDVMVWKLLRRDFARSREETEAIVRQMVEGVLRTCETSGGNAR
jgi:AcrR family transcriptional regulator